MFISELHVENYRSLRAVDLRFGPLTVVVGPNGSGKSNLLSVLEPHVQLTSTNSWRHTRVPMRRSVKGSRPFEEELQADHTSGQEWRYLRLHLNVERMREANHLQEAPLLASDGSNLTNVYATLPRGGQGAVAARLCELVPLYSDVSARPLHGGHHRLMFQDRWDPSVWFEPNDVSDGTILLLALLTISHLEPAPEIVAIEEPEHGLHPYLIGEVIGMLRDLASGRLGRRAVQVVVATHSAELLEFVEPEEVRFVSRSLDDGSTVVREAPLDTPEWRTAYAEYSESLGEMWLSGGLGGVPGAPPDH